MTNEPTSLSLLHRLASEADPDSPAWRRLVEVYQPLIRSWLAQYQVQPADAEDLTQEVLSVVARELPKFEHNRRTGAFRSWLRTVLVNRLRHYWRARDYRPVATGDSDFIQRLEELACEQSGASQMWDRQHDEHVVRATLQAIEPRFAEHTWQAFQRYVLEERPAQETADELQISIDSVYAAKSRVLHALRQEVGDLIG